MDVVIHVGDITAHLTGEQVQVMSLVAKGLTYQEIGEELGYSERAVCYRVQAVTDKLGAENRTVALMGLLGAGILG